MMIDQNTVLYGLVGRPVGHSLSPSMHNAAFEAAGLNAVYLSFDTDDIEACIKGMKAFGLRGLSVTIPFKEAVIAYLDEVDPIARKIGTVNTIINRDGRLIGANTDAIGFLKALEEKTELPGKHCLIIGAGGAARAVGFTLKEKGADLHIANRTPERGRSLAATLDCRFTPLNQLSEQKTDIIIQTTPVGMAPHTEACPVTPHLFRPGMVVMDIIYNPVQTRMLELAKASGCETISGLNMFIYQGAEQFRLWTGIEPPMARMRQVVEKDLMQNHERD